MNNLDLWFLGAGATLALGASNMSLLWRVGRGGSFKSGGIVLNASEVQVVIPPLCVLVHTVMLTLCGRRLIALPFANVRGQSLVS